MAAAGMVAMAVGDQGARLRLRRIDPGVGRLDVDAFGKRLDPGTEAGHRELYARRAPPGPNRRADGEGAGAMDLGGAGWGLQTIIGALLLVAVLAWAMLRNRSAKTPLDRTERGT